MDNKSVAKILEEIGVMIELTGGNPFRAQAHYNGARIIETLSEPVESLVKSEQLTGIKGIGKGLADKITELVTTGAVQEYEELKDSIPGGLFDMLRISGMGPKKVRAVYEKLGITTVGELEYACNENRLVVLEGFGKKSQENILAGILFLKTSQERHLYHDALLAAQKILDEVEKFPHVIRASIAGSIRRYKETVKDIDIIASASDEQRAEIMEHFTTLPDVAQIISKGNTKSSVRLSRLAGLNTDLRLVSDKEFPFALHHFTGSKEHNTGMRSLAKKHNLKMNEYGLFSNGESIQCADEAEIFNALGLAYIEPEMRENLGEIESAAENNLPRLITQSDIKGILHVHSSYSDGSASIEDMIKACIELGYKYIGVCDHSKTAFYANGLTEDRVRQQHEEIDRLQARYPDFTIFKGIEADILTDGSLDYTDEILGAFDFVVSSVHSKMKMTEEEATGRLERAVKNPYTTILGHPTGRLLLARNAYPVDMHRIIELAKEHSVIIELNASPHRFDLDWRYCKHAKEKGVKIAINPDAHSVEGISDVIYGVGISRKGWLEKKDVINSLTAEELKEYFLNRKKRIK